TPSAPLAIWFCLRLARVCRMERRRERADGLARRGADEKPAASLNAGGAGPCIRVAEPRFDSRIRAEYRAGP
ncbi:hypothetical protein NQ258_28075, partial [Escherichia coli]|nr:hypothetical protein [Escherichia coli]